MRRGVARSVAALAGLVVVEPPDLDDPDELAFQAELRGEV